MASDISEELYIPLSALQHFVYCRRQWALIHLEQLWEENLHTVEGEILHERAHDDRITEKRKDTIVLRGMNVVSRVWGLTGQCDIIEFHQSDNGITLQAREGTWVPVPVEYKRGSPKSDDCDIVQLCGQVLCLEEMLSCRIDEAYLYYGETRHREKIMITDELRERVKAIVNEMRGYITRKHTPSAKPGKACNACSLRQLCLPKLAKTERVAQYIHSHLGAEQ